MSRNTYTAPLPAVDPTAATPAFAVQVAPTVERMAGLPWLPCQGVRPAPVRLHGVAP